MRDLGSPTRDQTLALEALSLDQWTAREVPLFSASEFYYVRYPVVV